jgi:mono/diheme cytochrome c family protein
MRNHFWLLVPELCVLLASCSSGKDGISGIVVDETGMPIPWATVSVRATDIETLSNREGRFTLVGLSSGDAVFVTAWCSGYYINGVENVTKGTDDVTIILSPHTDRDNPDYEWLPSTFHDGQGEDQGCAACHSSEGTSLGFTLPVDEWLQDAHAGSALNHRFLTMYEGSDIYGNKSPQTRFAYSRDYGSFPLPPDPEQPYYGPGYKLDFQGTAGNCAACHAPLAAIDTPYSVDPTRLNGVEAEGVSCDFCHKVWDVTLDPDSGLPHINMPGVLSLEFRRPPEGHQFFAGPLDDVAPGEDTYSPIQQESQFCAPCHFGVFWDTVVYNSFGEWLESPYSDPVSGQSCQDCHMPPLGNSYFAIPERGGVERDPETIFSHYMPGASDPNLLQDALSMAVSTNREDNILMVTVGLTNDKTGHHIPTDSPLRQMILLGEAVDADGYPLFQSSGPTVPDWGGIGDPQEGFYAGMPGKGFAKILQELWTEISPTGAYWNPTRILSDNRLAAFNTDTSEYAFEIPADSRTAEITVTVTLLFRRAFKDLMVQKGWDDPDILMARDILTIQ